MTPSILQNGTAAALEETIVFAERRHAILAGNLANMDTPDYKVRDLSVEDFQDSLKQMLKAQKAPPERASPGDRTYGDVMASRNGGGQVGSLARDQAMQEVRNASGQIQYHDGSNDNLETQITQIAKNQTIHATAIALLKSQFRTLQTAISGNVGV